MTDYIDPSTHHDNMVDQRQRGYVLALVVYIGSIAIGIAVAAGVSRGVIHNWDHGLVAAVILGIVSILVGAVVGVYWWDSAERAENELDSLDKPGQNALFVEA